MTAELALAPLLLTGSAACLVLLLGVLAGARLRLAATWTAVAASLLALLAAALALPPNRWVPKRSLSDMWIADRMALFLDLVIASVTAMTLVGFYPLRANTTSTGESFLARAAGERGHDHGRPRGSSSCRFSSASKPCRWPPRAGGLPSPQQPGRGRRY